MKQSDAIIENKECQQDNNLQGDCLQGHLLIAMPSLEETFFERSVIYICEHDDKGAMGLIINRPIGLELEDLLDQMGLNPTEEVAFNINSQVLVGGPVAPERGFVLHSPQSSWINSHQVSDYCMLTTSRDVLSSIGTPKSPDEYLVALGYAGWGKDQLEQELAENTWLTIKATADLLYSKSPETLWEQATKQLGFDMWQISTQVGHA
ncbi:YqgE/AlgH family protein [Shewanella gaetbuli]|nr:YqgE/AlgH family protein [Shewanella gaetbuli]